MRACGGSLDPRWQCSRVRTLTSAGKPPATASRRLSMPPWPLWIAQVTRCLWANRRRRFGGRSLATGSTAWSGPEVRSATLGRRVEKRDDGERDEEDAERRVEGLKQEVVAERIVRRE